MAIPRALVLSGYGLNCEEESKFALDYCGAKTDILHINDLIESPATLDQYEILLVPGGFSYGDDTGSGNAYANKLKNHLLERLRRFVLRDTLTLGICNGCQILARLGLVPGLDLAEQGHEVGVTYNASNRYQCRWVDVATASDHVVWLKDITRLHIPVAHGEGNMVMRADTLNLLQEDNLIALRYVLPEAGASRQGRATVMEGLPTARRSGGNSADGKPARGEFPHNPNGAVDDIAAVADASGRVLAMMPHPERGMFFTQREDWPLLKERYKREGRPIPKEADGMAIFRNAIRYFA